MKRLKNLFIILMMAVFYVPAFSQQYISYSDYKEADCLGDLNGDKGMLILSKYSDLVLTVTNIGENGIKPVINYNGKGIDGLYSYEVIISSKETPTPNVAISRRGSVDKTNIIPTENRPLVENYFIAYMVEGVDNPIRYTDQTKSTSSILDPNKAAVELTSPMKNLQVKIDPLLQSTIKRELSKADPNIMIYTIEIPIKNYLEISDRYGALKAKSEEFKTLEDEASKKGKPLTDEQYKEIDKCETELKEAEVTLSRVNSITVFGEGTNYVLLNIEGLAPRVKKCYAILPLVIEKEVFVTECSRFMSEAGKLFSMRKYKEAKIAYTSALNANDIVSEMKPAIEESISLCDSCMMYDNLAARSIKSIITMKKEGTATQSELVKYATAAVDFLELLNRYNENEFYQSRITTMKKLIDNLPLKIKFTIVEWKTLNEGDYIPGVEVWTFNGDYVLTINSFSTDRKFKKMVDGEKDAYQQVGISDENGKVEIELDRKNLPKGVIFRPNKDSDVKIKYLPFTDLIRQAHGTYTEKQFRLKMFTKE